MMTPSPGRLRSSRAWKAAHAAWTRAAAELRITWEALANITARVAADAAAGRDRLEGLRRIGIDEKSWGKGQDKYLVIVTDHDAGRVAWWTRGWSAGCDTPHDQLIQHVCIRAGHHLAHGRYRGAGNNRAVSTATASSFLNNPVCAVAERDNWGRRLRLDATEAESNGRALS